MTTIAIHRRWHTVRRVCLPLWLGLGLGCPADDDDGFEPDQVGELGAGTFRYRCVGDTDPYCSNDATLAYFPDRIAVGGHFGLQFTPNDPARAGHYPVVPAGPAVSQQLDAFRFEREGLVAFLALDALGEVIDLRHFHGAEVDRVAVLRDAVEVLRVDLQPGDQLTLEALPKDVLGSTLAGSLTYQWSVADPSVAELVSAPYGRSPTVRGLRNGATLLQVQVGALLQQYDVRIGTGADPEDPEDPEEPETSESSGGTTGAEADASSSGDDTAADESSTNGDASTSSESSGADPAEESSTGEVEQ